MTKQLTPVSSMAFQNAKLKTLARDTYDLASLETVRRELASNDTLRLIRYKSGGCSAVTPLDVPCIDSALDGLLINMWDRDSILQAFGELFAEQDSELGEGLKITKGAWKKGLYASLDHHYRYQWRFLDIIADRKSGYDLAARPNIRYNPAGLFELPDHWGHAQNDAMGAINFMQFYALNRGLDEWSDDSVSACVPSLMHHYFWKVNVWADWELGAWEDKRAEHTSSIGIVLASLREQAAFIKKHGKSLHYCTDGRCFDVTESGVLQLIEKCEAKLREVLPNEFIRSDNGEVRRVDSALVNALFLSALSGRPLLDDSMTLKIIENMERELMGHIGFARYPGDVWDGRLNRPGMAPAQWNHVSPMISFVLGELFQREGKKEHFDAQVWHLNRTLAQVNERWHLPEAYIVHPKTGQWVSDENESLAWAQAMAICAFASMKKSLKKLATVESVPAASATTQAAVKAT